MKMRTSRRDSEDLEMPCPHCGYDLRASVRKGGLPSRETGCQCPECGQACSLWEIHAARQHRRAWISEFVEPPLWLTAALAPMIVSWLVRLSLGAIEVGPLAFWLIALGVVVYIAIYAKLLLKRLEIEFSEFRWAIITLTATVIMINVFLVRMMVVVE